MKKFLAIFLVLTLLFSFAACDKNGKDDESTTNPTEQTGDNGTTNKNEPSSNKQEKPTRMSYKYLLVQEKHNGAYKRYAYRVEPELHTEGIPFVQDLFGCNARISPGSEDHGIYRQSV